MFKNYQKHRKLCKAINIQPFNILEYYYRAYNRNVAPW